MAHTNGTTSRSDSLAYLDDYLDTIEALPTELQRNFSLMRELDNNSQRAIEAVKSHAIYLIDHLQDLTPEQRKEELKKLGAALNETLKNGDEKVSLATSTYDTVDRHIRRLDDDLQKFEDEQMTGPGRISATAAANVNKEETARNKSIRNEKEKKENGKINSRSQGVTEPVVSKRRKTAKDTTGTPPPTTVRNQTEKEREKPKPRNRKEPNKNTKPKTTKTNSSSNNSSNVQPNDMPIDPNEPVYCYCQQVSYGEMVACDNSDCKIEWFHYPCVDLKVQPKGKWYCRECQEKIKKQRR